VSAGRPARPTWLKIISGTDRPSRLRDDKPKNPNPPALPPGAVLTQPEQAMFDWLLENVAVDGVHGVGDGAAFVKIARLWARVNEVDEKIKSFGMLMKDPQTNRPQLQPYTRLSRDLWQQIGAALSEIGATPSGRVRIAGPKTSDEATSWDEIE
jgi:hypothetical protein